MLKKQITFKIPNTFSAMLAFKHQNKAIKESQIEYIAADHLNNYELQPLS